METIQSSVFAEGKTNNGTLFSFKCRKEDVEEVKKFLEEKVTFIREVHTREGLTSHGGYSRYSRFNITQHRYAGGGYPGCGGYIEVLEVTNPPDQRHGIIIHEYQSGTGSIFTQWNSLESACHVFEKAATMHRDEKHISNFKGFIRFVNCGPFTPWFYAVGDQCLINDFAFPEGFQEHPVYIFGKAFVVYDDKGFPQCKICMGSRQEKKTIYSNFGNTKETITIRVVYWHDGTHWVETKTPPKPLQQDELWITEALEKFSMCLAGRKTEFSIKLLDEAVFTGKISFKKEIWPEGDYHVTFYVKGEDKPRTGWIYNFVPTPEIPTIPNYINEMLKEKGLEVETIQIVKKRPKKGGKKWLGVFFPFSKKKLIVSE